MDLADFKQLKAFPPSLNQTDSNRQQTTGNPWTRRLRRADNNRKGFPARGEGGRREEGGRTGVKQAHRQKKGKKTRDFLLRAMVLPAS